MDRKVLRKLQLRELECLNEVKRICDNNNIEWFLAYGSALGAIRHNGFIPWDDDIDICMTVKNYKKFIEAAKTQLDSNKFFLQTYSTDKYYGCPWIKIRMNNTCSMDRKFRHKKMHYGICIDIFCLWYIPKEEKKVKKLYKYISKLSSICYSSFDNRPKMKMKNAKQIIKYYRNIFLRNQLWLLDKIEKKAMEIGSIDYGQIYQIDSKKMPSKLVNELYDVEFEGQMLPCPKNYDEYLTTLYGNYMRFPNVSERYGHKDIIIDVDKSFEEYRY